MTLRLDGYDIVKHRDDEWIDTICLSGPLQQPLLRMVILPRYKMSGLSGDEWRFAYGWQCTPDLAAYMQGDLAGTTDPSWLAFDTGYGSISAACAALFPGVYRSQPQIHERPVLNITFSRKGRILYMSDYDGQALPLLACAGHLPWAWVMACDEPLGTDDAWQDMRRLCTQPGCVEPAVSTYQLLKRYRADGSEYEALGYGTLAQGKLPMIRRFCPLHLRRGDCGLDDADANYRVLDGPGPEQAIGWREYISQSQRVIL